jgi:hypothetical protein
MGELRELAGCWTGAPSRRRRHRLGGRRCARLECSRVNADKPPKAHGGQRAALDMPPDGPLTDTESLGSLADGEEGCDHGCKSPPQWSAESVNMDAACVA